MLSHEGIKSPQQKATFIPRKHSSGKQQAFIFLHPFSASKALISDGGFSALDIPACVLDSSKSIRPSEPVE